jgi:hypothetical protein
MAPNPEFIAAHVFIPNHVFGVRIVMYDPVQLLKLIALGVILANAFLVILNVFQVDIIEVYERLGGHRYVSRGKWQKQGKDGIIAFPFRSVNPLRRPLVLLKGR